MKCVPEKTNKQEDCQLSNENNAYNKQYNPGEKYSVLIAGYKCSEAIVCLAKDRLI